MNVVTLENWSLNTVSLYSAPELGLRFHGKCYSHPKFDNGTPIFTSVIVGFNTEYNAFVTMSGNLYKLGTVSEDYESRFPDALNRVMKVVQERWGI